MYFKMWFKMWGLVFLVSVTDGHFTYLFDVFPWVVAAGAKTWRGET